MIGWMFAWNLLASIYPYIQWLDCFISNDVVVKWVACIKDEEDDNKDVKWIADLFKLGIVCLSFIPSKDFRILRELLKYKCKLTGMKSYEKNRFANTLTIGNCKLDIFFWYF